MKNAALTVSAALLLLSAVDNVSAQSPVEGVHFEVMRSPLGVPENTVISVFSPPCPHCYRLEEPLAEWVSDNDFNVVRVPFFHEDNWENVARLVLAIQATPFEDEPLIAEVFEAIHEDDVDEDDVDALIASLSLDSDQTDQIHSAFNSSEVSQREEEIRTWLSDNRIVVVPTVIIEDVYFTDPARARGNQNLMLLLDHLISLDT